MNLNERQQAVLVEGIAGGHKNSHSDDPSGESNHCDPYSDGNHYSSRLCHEGLLRYNTSLPQRSPALKQCTSPFCTLNNQNIITESIAVNSSLDAAKIQANIDNALSSLNNGDEWLRLQMLRLKANSMDNVCNGLRAILHYALTGNKAENLKNSVYANATGKVQSGIFNQEYDGVLLSLRLSDHFAKVEKIVAHETEQQVNPKQRLSIVANNTERTKKLQHELPASEKTKIISQFDNDPTIVRTEVAFNLTELAAKAKSQNKTTALLQAILNFLKKTLEKDSVLGDLSVVLQHAYPKIITAYQIDDDGNTYVNGVMQAKRSSETEKQENTSVVSSGSATPEPQHESVMDPCQRQYAVFLENVCNKFNCPQEAREKLRAGFRAYCNAERALL